jgi:hypothetical protein
VVSHHQVVRDTTWSALVRLLALMAAVMPIAASIQVLVNAGEYRRPAAAIAVWLAVLAAAAWLVPRMRAGGLTRAQATAALLIAVAAVVAIGWDLRPHQAGDSVDLAIVGTTWLLILAALSRPPRDWVPGAVAVFAGHTVLVLRAVGTTPLSLSQLEAPGYILVAALTAFAALRPTLAVLTGTTARRAALASRSAAERAATAAVLAERRDRLALLETEALALLRGIADGTLDPADDEVRERCAWHAAVLRHSLTGRAPDVSELAPALQAAAARGLLVEVQVIGDPGTLPPEVARAAAASVDAVLGALAPHQVLLTVVAGADEVEMYLTFSEPLRTVPDLSGMARDVPAAARWHASLDAGCLEIGWRKGHPVDPRH